MAYWTRAAEISACPIGGYASPTVLTSFPFPSTGIAVDATTIYWAVQLGGLMKCAMNACSSSTTTLVSSLRVPTPGVTLPNGSPSPGDITALSEIAIDDAYVYILDDYGDGEGQVLQCAKSGCNNNPTILASGLNGPEGVALDADNVYLTEEGNNVVSGQMVTGAGRVAKCAKTGCNNSPTVVAANQDGPLGIAADATYVYWTTTGVSPTDGRINVAAK